MVNARDYNGNESNMHDHFVDFLMWLEQGQNIESDESGDFYSDIVEEYEWQTRNEKHLTIDQRDKLVDFLMWNAEGDRLRTPWCNVAGCYVEYYLDDYPYGEKRNGAEWIVDQYDKEMEGIEL